MKTIVIISFLLISHIVYSQIPTNGLVAYYPFTGNANDESGNENNGIVNSATLTTDRFDNPNSAYEFDGIDDYITIANSPELVFGANDFTIVAWIYPTTLDGSQGFTIITKHNSDDGSWGYRVANNSSTGYIPKINFGIAYPVVESYANTTVSLNSWQMVVIKRSGVNFDFYFNDQNDGSFISDKELTSIFSVIISGQGNIYSQRFIGKIDDVRIYNRALNNSEISSIYQSGGWSSLNNGLVAFYPFNGNANDESGNENNGIVNSATLTTDRFDNANSAYEFDGIDDYITIANSPELVFGANDFTIVAWIYPTAWNGAWGYNAIITKSISDDGLWCFRIRETSGNFPKINFSYGFPVVEFYANTFIPLSTWQMVAIRRNGINFDFFLNDQYDGNFTSDKELSTLSPVMISGQVNISNERFTGKIDDIRIYNRALDLQEITSLYIEGQQWNCGDSIIDLRDSQSYSTVQIDTQCWMGENQNIGTMIQGTNTMTDNSIIEKYCYNNDPVNCTTFGGLYQWNEMMQYTTQQQVQGICALGWHIPTDVEWTTLSTFLGGESVTGGKLKETGTTHWNPPNTGATNESGFTALPGGFLYNVNYNALGDNIFFQTSTSSNNNDAWSRTLSYNIASLVREGYSKNYGFSVRCIKDIPSPPSLPSNPQPPNGSIDQPQNTTLSWTCTDPDNDPLIYDVYFGVTNPPALVSSGQTITTYNPGSLNYSITYYWKIDAIDDDDNISEGQIWTFSTEGCADIAVIPDTFNLSLYGTNNSITLPLTIYNTGQCDLIWEIDTSTSINYTLQFDGSNDYVNIGQSFGDFSEFTIEFLRKSTGYGTSNWPRMVTGWRNQPYNGSNDGFTIEHSASDQNAVSIWFSPDGTNNSVGTFSVSQNSWNHIALTFDGSLAKIYFDGNEVGQQSYSPGMITTLNNIQFGGDQPTGRYFNGQLDEIRLWNYALSETSIQQKMFSSISSPIQGLVGSWNFNEGSETSVNDQSGFNRNGTIFGANWIQSDLLLSSNGFTSFDIYSGVITPGSSSTVNVTFSSSGLTAGTYIEFININSNDTQNPVVTIPVNLVVYDSVHVVASAEPSDICVGESVQLDATASGGYGNYSYSWTSDPPGFNSSLQNPVVAPTTNTTYYVEVSDGFDSDTGSVLVSVFLTEPPSMVENMLPPDSSIIPQPIITFSWQPAENASFYDLYVWEAIAPPPSQPVDSNITSIQYTYNNLNYATSYKWKLIAKNPCFQTESQIQSFEVAELPDLIVTDIQVPANPMTGQEIQISWTTFNQGNNETQTTNWHDAIYLSQDSIPNTSVDTYLGSFQNLTSLSPNTGYNQLVSITLPENLFNDLYIIVNADHYNNLYEADENNNYSHKAINISLTPPPDLTINNIIAPTTAFSGEQVSIQWETQNVGSGAVMNETWVDNIYISQDPVFIAQNSTLLGSYYCNFDLLPDSSYNGLKQVSLPDYISGTYYIHVFTDVNNTVFEHANEDNNTASEDIDIVLTPPPDLTVIDITNPSSVSSNEQIGISWTLKNIGASGTISYWTDKVFISTDSIFNEEFSIEIGQKYQNIILEPDDSISFNINLTTPLNLSGNYYLFVYTDFYNQVFEYLNENNNIVKSNIEIQINCPDLVASNISSPDTSWSGQNITLNWSVSNSGSGNLINQTIRDKIYISEINNYNSSNITEIAYIDYTNNINIGDTLQKSQSVKIPDGYDGLYYLFVATNADSSVFENNQWENNYVVDSVFVNLSPYPDLICDSINIPGNILLGFSDTLFYRVKNDGQLNIFGKTWQDKIFISDSPTLDTTEAIEINNLNLSQPLNVSGIYQINQIVFYPFNELKDWDHGYFHFTTDITNTIFETNESNNILSSQQVQINLPPPVDLELTAASATIDTTQGGQSIPLNWGVENLATPTDIWEITSWYDAVFLSTDLIWDTTDIYVTNWQITESLNTNESYSENNSFNVPHGVFGDYYFLIVTDYQQTNEDSNYDNNYLSISGSTPIYIKQTFYPDLQVDEFNCPFEGTAGQPINFSWIVSNIGDGPTMNNPWTDKIYLSTDFIINEGDIPLGSKAYNTNLAVSESYTDSIEIFLPNDISGNYIVIFKTDANDTQFEVGLGEENNIVYSGINIIQQPLSDLIVENINLPDTVEIGEFTDIQWTLENIGENPAVGYLKDIVYFSSDSVWDYTDPMFGIKENYISIAPLMNQQVSQNSMIPGLTPGNYFVMVKTNVLNNIAEVNTDNNTGISINQITVTIPELFLGIEKTGSLVNQISKYYELNIPDTLENETLIITLKGDSISGANEIFLDYDSIPTRSNHGYSSVDPFQGNQELIVPELETGKYYLMVYGNTTNGSSQDISLLANILPFEIRSVDAGQGGNIGNVTVKIEGAKFESDMDIFLDDVTFGSLYNQSIYFINSTELFATFNLNGASEGIYDVVAQKTDLTSTTLPVGFEVIDASNNSFYNQIDTTGFVCYIENIGFDDLIGTNIQHPASTRPNRIVAITIHFANNGSVDIPAPGRLLVSLTGVPLSFNPEDFSENLQELYIEFEENNGPPGILRPGAQGSITVYTKATIISTLQFVLTE